MCQKWPISARSCQKVKHFQNIFSKKRKSQELQVVLGTFAIKEHVNMADTFFWRLIPN